MFVIVPNRKELENQGASCICPHWCAVVEMVVWRQYSYKHLFVLTYSHLRFNVGLPPSFSFRESSISCLLLVKPLWLWSNIIIEGAVCRTKNRPAIQLCYPAVSCSRQVVSSFLPGRLGQVHSTSFSSGRPSLA